MLKLPPESIRNADPAMLRCIREALPLSTARNLFVLALVVPVAVFLLSSKTGASIYRAAFHGLVVAAALTTATAPVLAKAYRAYVIRHLMGRTGDTDSLAVQCRRMHRWMQVAAISLLAVTVSLNLTALWPVGSYALGVELWDPSLMPWLRHMLVAGLCGLAVSDKALSHG